VTRLFLSLSLNVKLVSRRRPIIAGKFFLKKGCNLGQKKMRNTENHPFPRINDEFAPQPKRATFSIIEIGEEWS